jgi:hypothetical protein
MSTSLVKTTGKRDRAMISGVAWKVAWLALAFLLSRIVVALAWDATPPGVQAIHQVFQNGAPSGVTIRPRGRDVMPESQTRFTETGSGVLISKAHCCPPVPAASEPMPLRLVRKSWHVYVRSGY